MIMTRGKDDPKEMYDLLGTKEYRKELDRQFKNEKSNFSLRKLYCHNALQNLLLRLASGQGPQE
jgi:hypothetical protein